MARLGIGRGNSVHHRPRSGAGLRRKQGEGSAPRTLFFWPYGLQCWRNSDKRKACSRSTWRTSRVLAGPAFYIQIGRRRRRNVLTSERQRTGGRVMSVEREDGPSRVSTVLSRYPPKLPRAARQQTLSLQRRIEVVSTRQIHVFMRVCA
jgi:hypothetical protein